MAAIRTRESTLTVDAQGRVLIPAEIRNALGWKPGDRLVADIVDGTLTLMTFEESIRRIQALVRQYNPEGRSLVDELIAERREAAARGD